MRYELTLDILEMVLFALIAGFGIGIALVGMNGLNNWLRRFHWWPLCLLLAMVPGVAAAETEIHAGVSIRNPSQPERVARADGSVTSSYQAKATVSVRVGD